MWGQEVSDQPPWLTDPTLAPTQHDLGVYASYTVAEGVPTGRYAMWWPPVRLLAQRHSGQVWEPTLGHYKYPLRSTL
jgi:hypothetical protein